jgi:ATP-dependent DNA helicase RecG
MKWENPQGPLEAILDRLAKPIAFASRDAFAHVSQVQGLRKFIDAQVRAALKDVPGGAIQRRFETLGGLFEDFDALAPAEKNTRLKKAGSLLAELRKSLIDPLETASPMHPFPWDRPVRYLKGVGPKKAEAFRRLDVRTLEELLFFLPWRYEDRTELTPVQKIAPNRDQTVLGTVQSVRLIVTRKKQFRIVEALIGDSTGSVVAKWFNQPYLQKLLNPGCRLMLSGRVKINTFQGFGLEFENPIFELLDEEEEGASVPGLHVGRIVPIYHETRGLSSRQIRTLLRRVLDEAGTGIPERLPLEVRGVFRFPPLREALEAVHFPPQGTDLESLAGFRTIWHQRLIFDEFLLLQAGLGLRRRDTVLEKRGISFRTDGPLLRRFLDSLPFRLTRSQRRVLDEMKRDMESDHPMNRLLQGDVGSGKTVMAVAGMVMAADSGYQAALMAPTEILAEQHLRTVRQLVEPLGLECGLVSQGRTRSKRRAWEKAAEEGSVGLMVGTHALVQEGIRFKNLGFVVVDEQHKFGVLQRATLTRKGYHPDVLVMTATPIPRTLALSVYGDLDVSVLDEMPRGRGTVETRFFTESQRSEVYARIRSQIRDGNQAFVVYPLVEESEKSNLRAAVKMAEHLRRDVFPEYRVGLVHGQLKGPDKERVMASFRAGRTQILVSTTVVEVGVDVPNATVMVIEHAERFGLAQLHQLRGRIGRGARASACYLIGSARLGEEARRRLSVLVATRDGFRIAEEDLLIRGPGEFFGTRQSGLPELRVANIVRDSAWLIKARHAAQSILAGDAALTEPHHRELREAMIRKWKDRLDLSKVG